MQNHIFFSILDLVGKIFYFYSLSDIHMLPMKFEYIWLDGYTPEPNMRGKTKLLLLEDFDGDATILPDWNFDGSSTRQAEGHSSDCVLKPVRAYSDATRSYAWIVMCEVWNADGTPHISNSRATIESDDDDFWFWFEQEYVIEKDGKPVWFPKAWDPEPQGKYYCGVWHKHMWTIPRRIADEHFDLCWEAWIYLDGINAEVLKWQWEYGVLSKGAKKAGDDVRVARYILMRLLEEYGCDLNLNPKPVRPWDRNGTGMHCNFSNKFMREVWWEAYFKHVCEHFGNYIEEHIAVYGSENEYRLTGAHETQSIHEYSFGVSDRGASIRIPLTTVEDGWKGRLEDRRPAANADPYKVAARVVKTVNEVNYEG